MGSANKTKGVATKGAAKSAVSKSAVNKTTVNKAVATEAAAASAVAVKKTAAKAPAGERVIVASAKPPKEKLKKPKLVRDSFAMPETEYEVLRDMKKTCMKAGIDIKKSELLRVGVALLKKQTPAEIEAALANLVPLKAGRPKKAA